MGFLLLVLEQEGQNQEPMGTEGRMGLRQNRWYPRSHLSHRSNSAGQSPDPHSSQLTSSRPEDSGGGLGAWVLRLSAIEGFEEDMRLLVATRMISVKCAL